MAELVPWAESVESVQKSLWAESVQQRARRAGFGLSLTLHVPRLRHLRDPGWR